MSSMSLSRSRAEILLAAIIMIRATGYLFSKLVMETMDIFNLLGVRFLLAFAMLAILFFPRLKRVNKSTLIAGGIIGVIFFLIMAAELLGLKYTTSGNVSFLENTAIVLVPLFQALLLRQLPKGKVIMSALLCLVGVACLTLGSEMSFGIGEVWSLIAAIFYAIMIMATDHYSHGKIDTLAVGIIQVGVIGILSFATALLIETPRLPTEAVEWGCIIILAVVCTGFGFTLQPVAQSGTTAERAGMFCALNPLVAASLGVLFLNEILTTKSLFGGILILFGILLAELPSHHYKKILNVLNIPHTMITKHHA